MFGGKGPALKSVLAEDALHPGACAYVGGMGRGLRLLFFEL